METQASLQGGEGDRAITPPRTESGEEEEEDETARVPADDSDTDEGLGGLGKSKSKQKSSRTRRARRKAYRPYYQLSQGERDVREEREKLRVAKLKERMLAKGRIIAPYNTSAFLMADQPSEDFYFSHQVEDDQLAEDFMCNEFKKDYEVHNINRLEKMSKEMLLNEYMSLERKNEKLEEKLETISKLEEVHAKKENGPDIEFTNRVINLQYEMEKLKMENQRLLQENQEMKKRLSTTESESEERSGSSSSSSCSSDEDFKESLLEEEKSIRKESSSCDDPGYESNQSKGEIK